MRQRFGLRSDDCNVGWCRRHVSRSPIHEPHYAGGLARGRGFFAGVPIRAVEPGVRRRLGVLLLVLGGVGGWFGWRYSCGLLAETAPYRHELADGSLLVVGDLQRTSLFESWVLRREQNDAERARLVRALTHEDEVAGLLLLGDLVFDGSSCADWERFDALLAPLRHRGILLALGNHDYWGPNEPACEHLWARFPWLAEQPWERVRWGSVALVVLDSNEDELGPEQWSAQKRWLAEALEALDADSTVRMVVLAWHHPPYTNSTVTDDEIHVQRAFVERLEGHPKVRLVLSGHAHAYEHFERRGVHYVVSGGGGGPRVALWADEHARHVDLFEGPSPRPFHYLKLSPTRHGLSIEARGFRTGETAVEVFDRFVIPWL